MDISDTLAPKSDQLDAVDLLSGPRVFAIERVSKGSSEQPVQIHLAEFPRPWRPSKSMRRVLVACWGPDASVYVGRRVRLFCDPDVIFGGEKVGGTRISHLSHIDKAVKVPLLISRGKSAVYTVEPLTTDNTASQRDALLSQISGLPIERKTEIAEAWQKAHGHQIKHATDLDALRVVVTEAQAAPEDGAMFPEESR